MPLRAQPGYRFDQWTTSDGLPQNSVVKIAQTRDGYLWLATHDGLARFDGVRFTVFDRGNTPALKSNRIIDLQDAAAGRLWILCERGELALYHNRAFTALSKASGLPQNLMFNLQDGGRDSLVAVTRQDGYYWQNGYLAMFRILLKRSVMSGIRRFLQ